MRWQRQRLRQQRLQRQQRPQQQPLGAGDAIRQPGGIRRRKQPLQRQLLNNRPLSDSNRLHPSNCTNKSVRPVAAAAGAAAAAGCGRD